MPPSRTMRSLAPDRHRRPDPATRRLARGLGWFSIGLGVGEIVGGAALARWLGRPDDATLIRLYGAREIVQGIGILEADDPTPWIWARVGGDVVDIATVLPALDEDSPARGNALVALMALAGVTALDIVCARNLTRAPS